MPARTGLTPKQEALLARCKAAGRPISVPHLDRRTADSLVDRGRLTRTFNGDDFKYALPKPRIAPEDAYRDIIAYAQQEAAVEAPAQRDELAAVRADADDYRRRWLEECRAHGDTRRALWRAQCELGDHSNCDDCGRQRSLHEPDNDGF